MPTEIETLKPCPFCGGNAEVERLGTSRQSMIVACENCGARMESGDVAGMTAPERWAWNRRALDTHSSENERLRRINATLMGDDEDAPRYTTKRLRLEIQRATEAQASRVSELEALLHEARDTMLAPRAVYEPLVAKIDATLLGGTDGR